MREIYFSRLGFSDVPEYLEHEGLVFDAHEDVVAVCVAVAFEMFAELGVFGERADMFFAHDGREDGWRDLFGGYDLSAVIDIGVDQVCDDFRSEQECLEGFIWCLGIGRGAGRVAAFRHGRLLCVRGKLSAFTPNGAVKKNL